MAVSPVTVITVTGGEDFKGDVNRDIYYFNSVTEDYDLDGDGFDDEVVDDSSPTVDEVTQTVAGWAASQSSDGPLYIYLLDHGGINAKVFTGELLTADQLRDCVDTFQNQTGRRVVLMFEACKSGSFADDLITWGQDRIIVTCSDNGDCYSQLRNGTVSFTQFFIDRLSEGNSVRRSWEYAKESLRTQGIPLHADESSYFGTTKSVRTKTMLVV